ncbi:hypothetical protein J6590_095977 [Homalodisca vitripennis]|nr:hypothetical protein J6590_095977 [Homalodisca vitripennis]
MGANLTSTVKRPEKSNSHESETSTSKSLDKVLNLPTMNGCRWENCIFRGRNTNLMITLKTCWLMSVVESSYHLKLLPIGFHQILKVAASSWSHTKDISKSYENCCRTAEVLKHLHNQLWLLGDITEKCSKQHHDNFKSTSWDMIFKRSSSWKRFFSLLENFLLVISSCGNYSASNLREPTIGMNSFALYSSYLTLSDLDAFGLQEKRIQEPIMYRLVGRGVVGGRWTGCDVERCVRAPARAGRHLRSSQPFWAWVPICGVFTGFHAHPDTGVRFFSGNSSTTQRNMGFDVFKQ